MRPEDRSPSGRLTRDSASFFGSTVGQSALWFGFVLLVARVDGLTARGALAFLMAAPTLLHFAATLGLETAILYFAGARPSQRKTLTSMAVLGGPLFGAVSAALAWLVFLAQPTWVPVGVPRNLLAFGLAMTPAMTAHLLLISVLVGAGQVARASRIRVAIPAVALFLYAVLAIGFDRPGLTTAMMGWASGHVLGAVWAALATARNIGIVARVPRVSIREILGYGLPAHAGNIANIAIFRIDALILGTLRGATELGIYAVAVNLAEILLYLPTAVANVILPASAGRGPRGAALLTRRALGLVTVVTTAGAAIGIVVSPWAVRLLFGIEFQAAATPLRILLVGIVGMGIRKMLWSGLAAQRRQGLASVLATVTLVLIVALDLLLIPRHGALGAAWASAIAYWIGAALMIAAFHRVQPRGDGRVSPIEIRAAVGTLWRILRERRAKGEEPPRPAI